eukprot:gene18525-24243_t
MYYSYEQSNQQNRPNLDANISQNQPIINNLSYQSNVNTYNPQNNYTQTFESPQIIRQKLPEVKQFDNNKERNQIEELAEFYAIIRATELLETAFSRDAVDSNEYTDICSKLISQFKASNAALITAGYIKDSSTFFRDYNIDCPRAFDRLVRDGVPATVMHGSSADNNRSNVKIVAETVQAFITALDSLKLNQRATDEIQPLIAELTTSLQKVSGLPPNFDGLVKMKAWLQKLNSLRASDEIEEDDARQLIFDIENSYNAFHAFLSKK